MISANHNLTNQLGTDVVYAPIRELPATFFYCCAVTVLEWSPGHAIFEPSLARLESLISHRPHLSGYEQL